MTGEAPSISIDTAVATRTYYNLKNARDAATSVGGWDLQRLSRHYFIQLQDAEALSLSVDTTVAMRTIDSDRAFDSEKAFVNE
jgi:hypothetical protein